MTDQEWKDLQRERFKKHLCMNCGEKGPHFVPPSLGESGFYHCKENKEKDDKNKSY